MVVNFIRAAACGAMSDKTVTFYIGGAGRPAFQYMVVDVVRGSCPRAHRGSVLKTKV
jgi:hypothetical protein